MREVKMLSFEKEGIIAPTRVDVIVYADMWTIEVMSVMAEINTDYCAGTDGVKMHMGEWSI